MLIYPQINPVAINIGSFGIHWYGLMYLTGFLFFLFIGKWRIKRFGHPVLKVGDMDDFLFYGAMGVIIGGRVGYCLFYRPELYLLHPLNIIKTWDGGMSFHGGLIGVCIGVFLFSRKLKCSFLQMMDFAAVLVPIGLLFGRIGNFINGELWGRVCSPDLPWGMIFPDGGPLPRHPSQIYEALCEGLLLLIIMVWFSRKPRPIGQTCSLFVIVYGVIRFGLEFFREPDVFATGIVKMTGLSLGQIYSIPMIIIGLVFFVLAGRGKFNPR
ncbi:MAG: prolipoprotein diacylglyceryl transferase [Proteobacteria bacterium]|nr:MAG: prolipoprotein diacylglyceryl transferase [Pseudomonadota bacterium]